MTAPSKRPPTIRIVREADGLRLVVDPARIEVVDGVATIRLTGLEEAWLAGDLADAHRARVFGDRAGWG